MRINHNAAASNTYSRLSSAQGAQAKSLEKLSSGLRINRAGDDAAGLAISEKMRGQVKGLNQAVRNAQDGISLIQTAEGGLNETHSILQRMRELAVQSSNDTNTFDDRKNIQDEIDQLSTEVTRIAKNTQFNGQDLLKGGFSATFHIGANKDQNMTIDLNNMDAVTLKVGLPDGNVVTNNAGTELLEPATGFALNATTPLNAGKYTVVDISSHAVYSAAGDVGLANESGEIVAIGKGGDDSIAGITSFVNIENTAETFASFNAAQLDAGTTISIGNKGLDVTSSITANTAIGTIDDAIKTVSEERSKLGATQNRLDHTINNLTTTSENLSAAESRIRDVDMAKEMMEFTKNNILNQASTAMLAQANQMPQGVLQLLG